MVDRAAISDLLIDFARALDDRDREGYAANYADEIRYLSGEPLIH